MVSEESQQKNNKKAALFILIFSATLLFVSCLFTHVFRYIRVSGSSMAPTYTDGEILLTNAVFNDSDLKYGAVVIFKDPEKTHGTGSIFTPEYLIKRIEGVPRDVLEIKNGILYRNGEKITDSDICIEDAGILNKPYTVPENAYFCMGDNRNESRDSRIFGAVDKNKIQYIVKKPRLIKGEKND